MQEQFRAIISGLGNVRSWRVATKLLVATALVMVALTIVIDLLVVNRVQSALTVQATTDVTGSTNSLKYLLDQKGAPNIDTSGVLAFGAWSANEASLVGAIKRNTLADATIYQVVGGKFVARGTTFGNGMATQQTQQMILSGSEATALLHGDGFSGQTTINGQSYIANYLPITDGNGQTLGALFTGKPAAFISEQTAQITGAVALVSLLLLALSLALIFFLLSRLMTRPLRELSGTAERITAGDYGVRMPIYNEDELGDVARTVNTMIERVTDNARIQEAQNAAMQTQIVKLLEEVSSVAEGDLTVEAEVSADALGAVADSFNYMIIELRQIIGRVNTATQQVGDSTDQILATTGDLNNAAQQQASRIADTSVAVEEMAVSIGQVSENAAQSARVAREARRTAAAGAAAVSATVAGMGRIEAQVQATARQIEQLGASSQEIGAIVSLIREVADQTELLALNAAIEAALAGEHGRGFAVVAEEVRRLAERVTVASAQIDTLVQGVQAETREAIVAMNEGQREVVDGARLADVAGQSLGEIDQIVGQLAELIEAISLAADQQARASAGIARAMTEISGITTGTTAGTQQAAAAVAALAALADDLRLGVAAFRLTAEPAPLAQTSSAPMRGQTAHTGELIAAGRS
jgi:methyl-accepting chemotaxis protein